MDEMTIKQHVTWDITFGAGKSRKRANDSDEDDFRVIEDREGEWEDAVQPVANEGSDQLTPAKDVCVV